MKIADRVADLPPYVFASLGRRIQTLIEEGRDVIRLDIGSPDLPPPDFIIEAMYRAAQQPSNHGYGGYYGTPALRKAMAAYYERRFGVSLDPDKEVCPLIGSKEGIANAALAFVDPGDVVLAPDPGYPTYSMGALLAGGRPVSMPLLPENDMFPDLDAIPEEVARAARMLWINYPNNPTGAAATPEFFERVVAFGHKYDILICHDNPYCDVTFDGYRPPSILEAPGAMEVALEFNSLSKTYNMAGWRVGMAVGAPVAVEALARTKTQIDSGTFLPIQEAAVVALTGDQSWLEERNQIYLERRNLILDGLEQVGLEALKAQAGLYVWSRIPAGETSGSFATRLLEETSVSITPGTAFGAHGEGFVRFSLGQDTARVREAMERLVRLLQ